MHCRSKGCLNLGDGNFFTPSPVYISIHALIFFTFVKGYSTIAESSYFKTFLTRERFFTFATMSYPGYSSIFNRIRREAGLEALKLARTMEKTTYKLEAHHRHLHFTHKAIENQWIPKSLRCKPPGIHPVFKRIMERTSKHCMRARISICHDRIRFLKETLDESKQQLSRNYGRFAYGLFAYG